MFCTHCGKEIPANWTYCAHCGGPQAGVFPARRLVRPYQGRKIAGVCLGIANYLNLDVTLVRIVWVILTLAPIPLFSGVLAYIVAWIIMPSEDEPVAVRASAQQVSVPQ